HDDLLLGAASDDGQDAWPHRSHDRRVTGQHAEVALGAGNIDLIDVAGEGQFFRRDKIEVEGGHVSSVSSSVTCGLDPRVHQKSLSMDCRVEPGNDDMMELTPP